MRTTTKVRLRRKDLGAAILAYVGKDGSVPEGVECTVTLHSCRHKHGGWKFWATVKTEKAT